jgi:hypothetical protein
LDIPPRPLEGTIEDLLLSMDIYRKHNNFYVPIAIPQMAQNGMDQQNYMEAINKEDLMPCFA